MIFGVVTIFMPPIIFPHGFKLNMVAYIKGLDEVGLPLIKRVAAGWLNVWQQDSAPCHTSKSSKDVRKYVEPIYNQYSLVYSDLQ